MTAYTGAAVPGAIPVVGGMTNGLGSGGIGDLLIGALLFGGMGGNGGFGNRFGMNGGGYGNGYGYGMGGCVGTSVQQAATGAVATDLLLSPAFQNIQSQISNLQENISTDHLTGKIGDLSDKVCCTSQNLVNTVNDNTRELSNGIGSLQAAQVNANFETLRSSNALQAAITTQNTQNLIQGINQSQVTNGLITNGLNNAYLAQLTGFTAIEKSMDGISKDMAECCCEIKSTIRDSIDVNNNNTQKILDSMASGRYQDLLEKYNASQTVVSNLIQTNVLKDNNAAQTATILHHIAPLLSAQAPLAFSGVARTA